MNSKILITVCGRGGSKGIPGKNIKPIGGKPLIAYTIEVALKYAALHDCDIILSTDSPEIQTVAGKLGMPTDYTRPDYLANDTVGKPDAIKHAMLFSEAKNNTRYDYVIDLDVTSPIRTLADIDKCLEIMEANPQALTVFSVNPCARNPYFNMVMEKPSGFYYQVCEGKFTTRQSAPKVYDMNGSIYVYSRESLMPEHPRAVTQRSLVYVMDHICFDLDEPQDYDYLAYLLDTGKITIG